MSVFKYCIIAKKSTENEQKSSMSLVKNGQKIERPKIGKIYTPDMNVKFQKMSKFKLTKFSIFRSIVKEGNVSSYLL